MLDEIGEIENLKSLENEELEFCNFECFAL